MDLEKLKQMVWEAMESLASEHSLMLTNTPILAEANLKRVQRKIEKQGVPFAMITGFRGDYSRDENKDRNNEIKMTLDIEGLPYVRMPGSGYKEGGEEGDVVIEDSMLVWDNLRGDKYRTSTKFFKIIQDLAEEFEQETFIYGGPRPGKDKGDYGIHLYSPDGKPLDEIWAGGPEGYKKLVIVGDTAEYWSKIAGRKTQFTEIYNKWKNYKCKSRLEAMKKQHYLQLAESNIKSEKKV